MYSVLLFFHIVICALLIVVVLLQQTRGGGMGSVFGGGGGGADTLFGGKGATPFFVRLTTGLAIGFFVTSISLVLLSRRPAPTTAVERGMQETPMQTAPGMPEGEPVIPEDQPAFPEEFPGGE